MGENIYIYVFTKIAKEVHAAPAQQDWGPKAELKREVLTPNFDLTFQNYMLLNKFINSYFYFSKS